MREGDEMGAYLGVSRIFPVLTLMAMGSLAVMGFGAIWIEMGRPDRLDFFGLMLLWVAVVGNVIIIARREWPR